MASNTTTVTADSVLKSHEQIWHGFTNFVKFGIAAVIILLVGMAIFLL